MSVLSFTEGHLGHVYLLAAVNLIAMNTCVQISLPALLPSLRGFTPKGDCFPGDSDSKESSGD